jgi:DNA-binding transcriptional MerR regulator
MLKIGEFSKLAQVSPKALRLYIYIPVKKKGA